MYQFYVTVGGSLFNFLNFIKYIDNFFHVELASFLTNYVWFYFFKLYI